MSVEEWLEPKCPEDGAVVMVEACGICRYDHHAWTMADPDVALPHIMGREMAGTVREVGPVCHGFKSGDRVTAPFILAVGIALTAGVGNRPSASSRILSGLL